jgi:CRP/FNR family transcriptional regulator, cyclic AMP receptor protein
VIGTRHRSLDHLSGVPLFSVCSTGELQKISGLITTLPVMSTGKVLASEGNPGREFVVIVEGKADVTVGGTWIATLGPGEFVGEIALLDGGPRTATVTCVTDVVAQVISHRDFTAMLDAAPSLARNMLIGLAGRLRAADRRLAY